MEEVWADIKGYEGKYQVSNLGNVRSLNYHRQKVIRTLKPKPTKDGYYETALYKDEKYKYIRTHRLVAFAFCKNSHNREEVNHIDGNKKNNRADNLEWVTSSDNQKHAYRLGLQKASGGALTNRKKVHCVELNITAESLTEMQRILFKKGYTQSTRLNRLSTVMNNGENEYLGLHFNLI